MHKPEFLGSTTVGERGQVVIPQDARNSLEIGKGEKLLVFKLGERGILLSKVETFEKIAQKMTERQAELNKIIQEIK
jgi:AbrB family looped-hinge helix DNA binding protein